MITQAVNIVFQRRNTLLPDSRVCKNTYSSGPARDSFNLQSSRQSTESVLKLKFGSVLEPSTVTNSDATRIVQENLLNARELRILLVKTGNHRLGALPQEFKTTGLTEAQLWDTLDALSEVLHDLDPRYAGINHEYFADVFKKVKIKLKIGTSPLLVEELGKGGRGHAYLLRIGENTTPYVFKVFFDHSDIPINMDKAEYGRFAEAAIGFHTTQQQVNNITQTYAANVEKGWLLDEYAYEDKPVRPGGISLQEYEKMHRVQFYENIGVNKVGSYTVDKGGFRIREWDSFSDYMQPELEEANRALEKAMAAKRAGNPDWESFISEEHLLLLPEVPVNNKGEAFTEEVIRYCLSKPILQKKVTELIPDLPPERRVRLLEEVVQVPQARETLFERGYTYGMDEPMVRQLLDLAMKYPECRRNLIKCFLYQTYPSQAVKDEYRDKLLASPEGRPYWIHKSGDYSQLAAYLASRCPNLSPG